MKSDSPNKEAISAVDGLFACLIYLGKTGSEMANLFVDNLCHHFNRYWERLRQLESTKTTPSLTALLNSFNSSTQFFEVAIFTFRNVLVGAKPDSLNAIFPLCSLSYITSCSLRCGRLPAYDIFLDVEVWRNAIRDPEEREAFTGLASVVWSQVSSISIDDTTKSQTTQTQMQTVTRLNASGHQTPLSQGSAIEFEFVQDESLFNGLSDPFWGLDAIDESSFMSVENFQRTSSNLQDLQGSAIVSNLICFLTECGELVHVFSGRGVTTKDLYSCIAFT
ncbi:hypothetical protein DER46DRAFT_573624 [Fusarium sp. MPI-SDFR-AT-0072]|nr:hypothetical protein DER46DRAFT_573624 [Fusarium sp. MPI-SDFR-AT-0072]